MSQEEKQAKVDRVAGELQKLLNDNGCILRTQVTIEGNRINTRAFIDILETDAELEVLTNSDGN